MHHSASQHTLLAPPLTSSVDVDGESFQKNRADMLDQLAEIEELLDAADLPSEARDYLRFIEDQLEATVALISTGPRREETILVESPELDRLLGGRLAPVLAERLPEA